MTNSLKDTIREMGIEVVIAHGIKRDGLYLPETDTIFVRYGLTDTQTNNVILHELGHLICKHADTPFSSPAYHLKQESQADDYWLVKLVSDYLSRFDSNPEYIDVFNFLSAYQIEIKHYDKAEIIISNLMKKMA